MSRTENTLTRQLKKTTFVLIAAMIALWLFSYCSIRSVLTNYAMESMERIASQTVSEINGPFLQLEQLSFALAKESAVVDFLQETDAASFHRKAALAENTVRERTQDYTFIDSIILYNADGAC